jgi:hypothetical protein
MMGCGASWLIMSAVRSIPVLAGMLYMMMGTELGLVVLHQGSRLFTNSRSNYESTRRGAKGKEMPMQAYYRPCVFQEVEDEQSAHEGGKVVSPTHRPSLLSRIYSWYSFLLVAESTPRPKCGRKDYVNEKFQ